MIRVSVMYPEGGRFDFDYWIDRHMPMARDRFSSAQAVEATRGVAAGDGGPPPYVAAAHMVFASMEAFQQAWEAHGAEVAGDIPNYTDSAPTIQISEIL